VLGNWDFQSLGIGTKCAVAAVRCPMKKLSKTAAELEASIKVEMEDIYRDDDCGFA
jgi:hypothetical protein